MANETTVTLRIASDGTVAIEQMGKVTARMKQMESETGGIAGTIKTHWLAISAAVTGALYSIHQAWQLAERAAQYEEQMASMNRLAATYNTTADTIVSDIQRVSKGMIAMEDAANIAGNAMMKHMKPDQLVKLAEASETLSNQSGKKVVEHFRELSEALASGKERSIKMVMGIVDLEAKYGKQVQTMTDAERAQALYNMVIERTDALQKTLGESVDSTGDKMERFTVQVKDLQLWLGEKLIQAAAGAMGILQGVAAAALVASAGIFKIMQASGWLTDKVGLTTGAAEEWKNQAAGAFAAAEDLGQKAKDNLALMIQGNQALQKAMAPAYQAAAGGFKKGADEIAQAMLSWQQRVQSLNPGLDEQEKKLVALEAESAKLIEKYGNLAWITEGLARGKYFIEITRQIEESKAALERETEAWMNRVKAEHEYNDQLKVLRADVIGKRILGEEEAARKIKDIAHKASSTVEEYLVREEEITKLYEERKLLILDEYRIRREKEIYEKEAAARQRIMQMSMSGTGEAGDLQAGLQMMQQGMWGIFNQAQGTDAYSTELEQLRQFWEEKVNLHAQGQATLAQVNDAWDAYILMQDQQTNVMRLQSAQNMTTSMLGIMSMLYNASGKQSQALFYLMKAAATAQAVINAWLAYTQALATPPGPPYTIPLANMALAMGLAGAAAIAATAFMSPSTGAGTGGTATGGTATVVQTTETATSATEQKTETRPIIVNFHNYGFISDGAADELARELVPKLQKAVNDGAH